MRYSDVFGYSEQVEIAPGKFENVVTEVQRLGRVEQRTENLAGEGEVLPRYRTSTSISVLSRGVAVLENADLAYVKWRGRRWVPASIVENYPEIKIFIGEEYNGPTPSSP